MTNTDPPKPPLIVAVLSYDPCPGVGNIDMMSSSLMLQGERGGDHLEEGERGSSSFSRRSTLNYARSLH